MIKIEANIPNFREVIVQLDRVQKAKVKELELELIATADEAVQLAKQNAPRNEGLLRNQIAKKKEQALVYNITAATKYAAFMEFGTKKMVDIPPGAEEIAAAARNIKGGNIQDMERAIRRWVKLKGLAGTYSVKTRRRTGGKAVRQAQDDQLVFLIMRKILRIGVKPQPFFYPAIKQSTKDLAGRLAKILVR